MHTRRLIAALAAATLIAACSGGDDDTEATVATTSDDTIPATDAPATTPAPTTSPPTTEAGATTTTAPEPVARQPLTGEPLSSEDDIIDRPALAVKIDNHPDARPNHSGLAVADLVFEEIVEGGLTRFAAVFHTTDSDPVGPVRSGRSQDVAILTSLDEPLFAWSGGNDGVEQLIANSSLTDLNWQTHADSYYRGPGPGPHNLYSSTQTLWALTPDGHPGAPPQQFEYLRDGETFAGEPTTGAELGMGSVGVVWTWDPASATFLRSQDGNEHTDVLNGRIGATNIVIMVVEYLPSQIDANSPEAQTTGEGPLYVLSDGRVVEGRWARDTADEPIGLFDEAGDPIALTPGITWVEIEEGDPAADIASSGAPVEILSGDG